MKGYKIEHKIRDPETNLLRDVRPEDLNIENHPGVRRSFKIFYRFIQQRKMQGDDLDR